MKNAIREEIFAFFCGKYRFSAVAMNREDHKERREKFRISVVIRREINAARARIVDQTRSVETSSFELSKQLDSARNVADYAVPHVIAFEHIRWIVGIGIRRIFQDYIEYFPGIQLVRVGYLKNDSARIACKASLSE